MGSAIFIKGGLMRLKDIIKNVGLMINNSDVIRYVDEECKLQDFWLEEQEYEDQWIIEEWWNDGCFDDGTEISADIYESVNLVVNLTNLVINELACTYFPMVIEEQVSFSNGKAFYKDFSKKVVKILGVNDQYGCSLEFIDKAEYLYIPSTINQTLTVKYQYSPDNYTIMDVVGYSERAISARLIAYGVASEYYIIQSDFEQAVMYHKRYLDEISLLTLPKNSKIKQRSWR